MLCRLPRFLEISWTASTEPKSIATPAYVQEHRSLLGFPSRAVTEGLGAACGDAQSCTGDVGRASSTAVLPSLSLSFFW